MPWLVRDDKVLATLEVAESVGARTRGLLGRDGIDGAILLAPARSVHTLRMRFAIDVAFCDADLRVLRIVTMVPNRVSRPVWRARSVIETEAGVIHTDFERGFIRAEVIHWDELLEIGSWTKARDVGKIRVEGKDYEVADGDVLEIRFNV